MEKLENQLRAWHPAKCAGLADGDVSAKMHEAANMLEVYRNALQEIEEKTSCQIAQYIALNALEATQND